MNYRDLHFQAVPTFRRYRKIRDAIENAVAQSTIRLALALSILALPFLLYADIDNLWTHMLAQFNDHATPLSIKISVYLAYVKTTTSWQVFTWVAAVALALDAIILAVQFARWWKSFTARTAS